MNHSFQNIEQNINAKNPTLFLPGWGFDGKVLRLFNPVPPWIYPDSIIDPETLESDILSLLASKNIGFVRIVGWSMGAMMGLDFAAKHPEKVSSLALISLRPSWPQHEIRDLQADFSNNPQEFLKNFFRKCFLGNKQAYRDFHKIIEPQYLSGLANNTKQLQGGLEFLAAFIMPVKPPLLPIKLIHGRQDIIAPVTEMASIEEADVEIIENSGHEVLLHEDCSLQKELKKNIIQLKFSRAAGSYDSYAKVQAEVARRLVERLPATRQNSEISNILEIGCGTGNFTAMLAERFPTAKITALDFSMEMLDKARHKLTQNNIEYICAEAEQFLEEEPDKSFDLVTSNGSLQWFSDADRALGNIRRILRNNGSLYCSIFGPKSIDELGQGLKAVGSASSSLAAQAFPQPSELEKSLENYFQEIRFEDEFIEKKYRSTLDLLLHIQKTGTSGWQHKKQTPLTPRRVKQLDEWFEKTYGVCKVTYQVLFLYGKR